MGSYPPPVGGNSVHIKRLSSELFELGYKVQVIDLYGSEVIDDAIPKVYRIGGFKPYTLLKAIFLIKKINPDIIHVHVSAISRFIYIGIILHLIFSKKTLTLVTIHSGSFVSAMNSLSSFKRRMGLLSINKFDKIISVNENQNQYLLNNGFRDDKLSIIPAYLPPIESSSADLEKLIFRFESFGKPIIILSGSGLPLYGHHLVIQALLEDDYLKDNVSLLLCLYNESDESYMRSVLADIQRLPCADITYDLDPNEFAFLIKRSAIYIRPTDRDGDSVAIREANYFGLQVVASDVVPRPIFCFLFSINDVQDLKRKIKLALSSSVEKSSFPNANNFESLLEIYKSNV